MKPRTSKKPQGISTAAYAEKRGVTRQAVLSAEDRGFVVRYRDRSINVEETDRLWDEGMEPRENTPSAPRITTGADDPLAVLLAELEEDDEEELEEPDERRTLSLQLTGEKAKLTAIKARQAEMKLRQEMGELVSVKDVGRVWFGLLRSLRQRLRAIPSRTAAAFASQSSEHEIRIELAKEIDEALSMLPEDVPLG